MMLYLNLKSGLRALSGGHSHSLKIEVQGAHLHVTMSVLIKKLRELIIQGLMRANVRKEGDISNSIFLNAA